MGTIKRLILLVLFLTVSLSGAAQVRLGIRDNLFAWIGYSHNNVYAAVEQSFYSEKPSLQHMRLIIGYRSGKEWVEYSIFSYAGMQWSLGYYDLGAGIDTIILPENKLMFIATVAPHYDSGIGWVICSRAGLSFKIVNDLKAMMYYSNIPEFRMPEHRIKVGFSFGGDKLNVTPLLSIPMVGDIRNSRVLVSFSTSF